MARILLVDDDKTLSESLRDWLLYEKNDVDYASEGVSGLHQLTSNYYHLAIIDWDMPGLSGPEIVRRFRASGGRTPILLLTARAADNDKELGLDSGADDYLTKPFSIKELGARMRSLLRRSNPGFGAGTARDTTSSPAGSVPVNAASPAQPKLVIPVPPIAGAEPAQADTDSAARPQSGPDGAMRACTVCGRKFAAKDNIQKCTADGSNTVPISDTELVGLVLDNRFQIEGLLGLGAWSEVYRGRDLPTGTIVAIKILHKHMALEPLKIERFRREAATLAKIDHECLARIIDQGTTQGRPFIIMEYVVGMGLDHLIAQHKRLSLAQTYDIFESICAALSVAHNAGMIHRDLKPSNIFVITKGGNLGAKLLDFGLAKMVMDDGGGDALATLTQKGEVLGTPAYMSPEQCMGHPLDKRSDLYSLGCILYETLTGCKPIRAKNAYAAMSGHITRMPDPIWQVCPEANVPPAVEQIVFRLLNKDPDDRFESAEIFLGEFRSSLS